MLQTIESQDTSEQTQPHFFVTDQIAKLFPLQMTTAGAAAFGVKDTTFVSWRWQMLHQIYNKGGAEKIVGLTPEEAAGFDKMSSAFQAGITPYYAMLMKNPVASTFECPIRLQAFPTDFEAFDPSGVLDPLDEVPHAAVKEVVHVYPDRVAFCVAQLCPVYCRYCFRKRRDDEEGLHFNRKIVDRGIEYIASNPAIRDVLITGGDPFLASDEALEKLVQRIRAIPHIDIIRFGTRTPVTLPYRVTKELGQMLAKYHPIFVNTHFNCEEELTAESAQAIANLVNAGIPVGNQSVLLKHVNDTPQKMLALLRGLLKMRVRPYYLFHPHNVAGTFHLRPSIQDGLKLMKQIRGKITGLAIPTYVVDTPGGKIPLVPNHVLGYDGPDLLLENSHGEIWRERNVVSHAKEHTPVDH